jgi:hypothetical protein
MANLPRPEGQIDVDVPEELAADFSAVIRRIVNSAVYIDESTDTSFPVLISHVRTEPETGLPVGFETAQTGTVWYIGGTPQIEPSAEDKQAVKLRLEALREVRAAGKRQVEFTAPDLVIGIDDIIVRTYEFEHPNGIVVLGASAYLLGLRSKAAHFRTEPDSSTFAHHNKPEVPTTPNDMLLLLARAPETH